MSNNIFRWNLQNIVRYKYIWLLDGKRNIIIFSHLFIYPSNTLFSSLEPYPNPPGL